MTSFSPAIHFVIDERVCHSAHITFTASPAQLGDLVWHGMAFVEEARGRGAALNNITAFEEF